MNTRLLSNCKACVAFKRWVTKGDSDKKPEEEKSSSSKEESDHNECPLDTRELGIAAWGLMHSIAAYFPENPTATERHEIACLFRMLAKYYPCSICAKDFQEDLKEMPPETESGEKLSQWLCKLHNKVNKKLGKPPYDCSRVKERWRDGWKDGSCD
ncbi:FAD-linked sulfhydryl oxidase ALR [Halyomorpha halys]|uniref:FAD-linked sulfhydryl oxidase ALR n=1 Tax=Halyomorpha halys TaxID=286706 RepID=UPI0006D502B9|nr:FAD-linked sulfhydryl oxidase ALR isoform X2 [Halyomorpha halys]XP_014284319.1 FAD-linked sulfhydryl oxidase ALR isoform X2 [Halyomorpha halys]XP_014284321.1 FAD-linked sulfhydryl oxidase ALR isoform X2 [Halyomorpha halys]XP_024215422.1 FAD-linked sulfhydryl oxidase ALR isoform X2 [Halyomorpha halys]